jgi:sigma-E factor negative regulatory protein RseA
MNNTTTEASIQEQLSAMADGELDITQVSSLVQASRLDASLMQTWASYHTIGQVLRGHSSTAVPAVAAPDTAKSDISTPVASVVSAQGAANDSVFRWKLVAGVAALAAVGSMVWALVGTPNSPTGAQLAQRAAPAPAMVADASTPTPTAAQSAPLESPPVMIRDPHLDELLAAHKQFGGASALQQPAGFLRNATFQPTGR